MLSSTGSKMGFADAHARLTRAQKSPKGAPAYSLYVNRPLGRVLAAAAYQVGLTPNQMTYLSALFSLVGVVGLAVLAPSWLVGVAVSLALVLGYACDAADGQLARLRGGGSALGEWLDHMIDSAKVCSVHLAVLIMAHRHFEFASQMWLLVPLLFAVVSSVHFFGMILVDQLVREARATSGLPPPAQQAATPLRTLLKTPTDYGVLCLAFALLGAPEVFFSLYVVCALASTAYLVLILRKWRNDVAQLDAESARVR
ncbi:MAG TPA: CDP-alcohol phosphatidyltransferase family protein [Propionibacteriaceae bacterium]|nr:CDP-alcohol phosphatidyltransferase family protein [Propionibacteriaceae bacterium]